MLPRINKLPKDIIALSPPYLTRDEEKVLSKVIRSGILGLGPYLEKFESEIARFVGTRYAVATSSGTAGLHLALYTLGLGRQDEVITSPFSFVASANVILYVGARPVFVDIDPVTLNIDPLKIEAVIGKRTRAILPVHIFGYPIDYEKIARIAGKYKFGIVEDACESLGATYKGRMVGNFGNLAVFAFYANKQITTGEGGMIVTDDKRSYSLLKSLVNQGRSDSGQWLTHDKLGFNFRLDELSAAVGYVQMKKIRMLLAGRRKVALTYQNYLKNLADIRTLPDRMGNLQRSWQTFVVILDEKIDRNSVISILAQRGIASKPYLPSIHLQPYWRKTFGYKPGMFPISEAVSKSSLALPLFVGMTDAQVARVCEELEAAMGLSAKKR